MGSADDPGIPLTQLLQRWTAGDEQAFEELVPLVYEELRRLAKVMLAREKPGHTLNCTALVHEAYLRLVGRSTTDWESRSQFFGAAARAMRRVLVDHARARHAKKRGDGVTPLELDEASLSIEMDLDVLSLDRALEELAALDPERAKVVELRYFGGLSIEETAALTRTSPATVKRDWLAARAWLFRRMTGFALH
ncbi:MAG: sigma-70 family RNA polymerase sigma factor [Bryobacterales bacterium]|nr:sigma-70 family RNA polymerase sigma factor [Bryobacterales bacterium]